MLTLGLFDLLWWLKVEMESPFELKLSDSFEVASRWELFRKVTFFLKVLGFLVKYGCFTDKLEKPLRVLSCRLKSESVRARLES